MHSNTNQLSAQTGNCAYNRDETLGLVSGLRSIVIMSRFYRIVLLLFVASATSCISLAFSRKPTTAPEMTINPIITQSPSTIVENPAAIGPDSIPPGVNPLTGQPVADPAVLNRRPIVGKISNAPVLVGPQAGIGAADIVYETYGEGGLARFYALFYR